MKYFNTIVLCVVMSSSSVWAEDLQVELTASKDTFGRSDGRNRNSGANEYLMLAPLKGASVGLIAFDLSSVTNEITSAEFSFRIHEDSSTPFSLIISPMVHNTNNTQWTEGKGSLGNSGQNARIGEVTYQWRAFRDRTWEDKNGKSVVNLMSSNLWKSPIEKLSSEKWDQGRWISVQMDDPALLEAIRTSDFPIITFGIWGTSGNGAYKVSAKESGHPAKLSLNLQSE